MKIGMKKQLVALGMLLLALPGPAAAASTVLTGSFDGSEARTAPMYSSCDAKDPLAFQEAGTLRVSASGSYSVLDVLYLEGAKYNGVDLTILLYSAAFDAASPSDNLVRPKPDESGMPFAIDTMGSYDLDAGQTYRLVVQQACVNKEGAWAVSFTGPGSVESGLAVSLPSFSIGAITSSSPASLSACGPGGYRQSGPFRFERGGTYYFQDISVYSGDIDVCVQIYTAPFDPAEPNIGRVPTSGLRGYLLDNSGTVELEGGRDYWFVVQPRNREEFGSYAFMLAPPAPFRINRGLAGAWYNPDTSGQGFLMDVYDNTNELFVGWYTYELQRPVDGTAVLGEPGHRWLTAFGAIQGARAELGVFLAQGGAFDNADPPIQQPQSRVGAMTVEFDDCVSGTVDYDLTNPPVSGQIPIQALTLQHVESCELASRGPGEPGPL